MTFAKISQAAHYAPIQVISNQDLSERMDTSDEWIASRTGIRKRHISKSESTSDLATEVARRLLGKVVYKRISWILSLLLRFRRIP